MNMTSRKDSGKNIGRRYNIIPISIALILIAAIILPETYAFDLGFLDFSKKKPTTAAICTPSPSLTEMINEYNGIQLSTKLYDFVKKNRYQKITATVTEKKCSYQYTILVGTSRIAAIKQGSDNNAGLKISTTYDNILAAEEAYENSDTIGLIKTAMGINMPIGTKLKALIFLRSYL